MTTDRLTLIKRWREQWDRTAHSDGIAERLCQGNADWLIARVDELEVLCVRAWRAHTGESGESMGDVLDDLDRMLPLERHIELLAVARTQAVEASDGAP